MNCDNRLRIMGDASIAYRLWKEDIAKQKAEYIALGLSEEQASEKALVKFPKPVNPYKEETLRYEFWYTGFRNAEMNS